MEMPENSESSVEESVQNVFEENDENKLLKELDNKTMIINNKESDIDNKEMIHSITSNEDKCCVTSSASNNNCNKIILNYLSGDWQSFFNVWNISFSPNVKELIEYKIITLKLRVHFAILPIRIIQLHQNISCESNKSSKVLQILENVADKLSSVDVEKDSEGEQNKLTIESMKQLEEFLNSCDGQKLTIELKDSSFMTFFALPYIMSPHEDESVKKTFSIDWLEELTIELEKFVSKFYQEEFLFSEQELEISEHLTASNENQSKQFPTIETFPLINSLSECVNNHKSKLTDNNGELISCDRIIHSVIKNKEIEDWIAHHQHIIEDSNLCTKGTQTRISSIKTGTGFSLVSEPHHFASVVTPSAFTVPNKQSILYNDELILTKSRLFNVHKHYRKLKLRFHELHEDYQKMNEIAEELTIALQNSVSGQPVNMDMILKSCMKIFPDRFNRDIQTDSEDTSIDLKQNFSKNITIKENIVNNIPVPPKLLDYKKIKLYLRKGGTKTKLLLLQALRQKLTLTQPEHRDETIHEYTNKDLLGLQGNVSNTNENNILPYILQPINSESSINFIQQTTTRFLNTLASLSCGRAYLANGPIVLNAIIKYLDSCNDGSGDAMTLDMLLATLQKMSLRKQQRNYMIEANLVEWLIYHLSNENFRMGTYRLEYTCALLMNLSLQSAARSRATVIAPLFISTMTSLLSTDCISALPYINGALQNFLLNNEINEEAKKLHLAEILDYYCIESGEELRNYFSHTLKIHKRECDENLSDGDEFPDEDDEIFDILENELEENDPVKVETGQLRGENLLAMYYSVPSFFSQLKNSNNKSIEAPTTQTFALSSRESKKPELNASTIITASETIFDDFKTEMAEKKSGTGVASSSKKAIPVNREEIKPRDKEEVDAFLAKPKLMRTPPSSARIETNREKVPKKMLSKTK